MLSAGLLTGVILGLRLGLEFELTLDPAEPVTADVAQFGISTFAAATASGISPWPPTRRCARYRRPGWRAGSDGPSTARSPCSQSSARSSPPVSRPPSSASRAGFSVAARERACRSRFCPGSSRCCPGSPARGFYQLATQNVVDGLVTMTLALAIGLALAAGVALGAFIAGPRAAERQAARREAERMTSPPCRNRDLGSDTPVHWANAGGRQRWRPTRPSTATEIRAVLDEHAAAHAARDADRLFAAYSADAVCYTLAPPLQRVPTPRHGRPAPGSPPSTAPCSTWDPVVTAADDVAFVHLTR